MAKPSAKKIAADRKRLHDHYLEKALGTFGYTADDFQRMFGSRPQLIRYGEQDFSDVMD